MKQKPVIFLLLTVTILLFVSCQVGKKIETISETSVSPTITPTVSPTNTPTPIPTPTAIKIGEFGKSGASEVLWSPDGKYLVVRTSDEVELVNTQTWEFETSISIPTIYSETQMFFDSQGINLHLATWKDLKMDVWQFNITSNDQNGFIPWKMGLDHSFGSLFYLSPSGKYLAITEWGQLEILDLANNRSKEINVLDTTGYENKSNIAIFNLSENQIAMGLQNNVIKIINPQSGTTLITLNHNSHINDLTYSPDDTVLVSASNDATIKFWNAITGKPLASLDDFQNGIGLVRFFDNGSKLLVGEENTSKFYIYQLDEQFLPVKLEKITIIDKNTSTFTNGPENPEGINMSATNYPFKFNPETMEIALLQDGTVEIWDLNSSKLKWIFPEYGSDSGVAVISSDSQQLAIVNNNIHLWSIPEHKWISALPLHSRSVDSSVYSPAGNILAVSSEKIISLWDTDILEKKLEIQMPINGEIMAFSQDGSMLAAAGINQILIFDSSTGEMIQKMDMDSTSTYSMCFSDDNAYLYLISENERTARKISNGEKLYGFSVEVDDKTSAALTPGLGVIVESKFNKNKTIITSDFSLFDPSTGEICFGFTFSGLNTGAGAFLDPTGNLLIIDLNFLLRSSNRNLLYINAKTGEIIRKVDRNLYDGTVIDLFDNILISKNDSGENVILEDVSSFNNYIKNSDNSNFSSIFTPVQTLASSPDQQTEINQPVAQIPEVAQVIGPENITSLSLLKDLSNNQTSAATWSSDGHFLATANELGIDIIDIKTHETLAHIPPVDSVSGLLFSPDNHYLAAWATFSDVKVFDTATGKEIFSNHDKTCQNQRIIFEDDSETLTLFCEENTFQWNLPSRRLIESIGNTSDEFNIGGKKIGYRDNLVLILDGNTIRLINTISTRVIHTFDIPNYYPASADISPNNKFLYIWYYKYNVGKMGNIYAEMDIETILQIWSIDEEYTLTLSKSINAGKITNGIGEFNAKFTPDGNRLFASIKGDITRIWQVPSGKLLSTLPELSDFHISPNGKYLYALSMPDIIWDITGNGKPTIAWSRNHFENTNIYLTITNDSNDMVTLDGTRFKIWEMIGPEIFQPIDEIDTDEDFITSASVSPNGEWLAYTTNDELIIGKRNKQFVTWYILQTYTQMDKNSFRDFSFSFSPDSTKIVALDVNHQLAMWDLKNPGTPPIYFEGLGDFRFKGVYFSPDSKYLLGDFHFYSGANFPRCWNIETQEECNICEIEGIAFDFDPRGNVLAVGSYDNLINFYDFNSMELIDSIDFNFTGFEPYISYNPSGSLFAAKNYEEISFYDNDNKNFLFSITGEFVYFHYTPDGKYLITIGRNNQIKIWGIAE